MPSQTQRLRVASRLFLLVIAGCSTSSSKGDRDEVARVTRGAEDSVAKAISAEGRPSFRDEQAYTYESKSGLIVCGVANDRGQDVSFVWGDRNSVEPGLKTSRSMNPAALLWTQLAYCHDVPSSAEAMPANAQDAQTGDEDINVAL